MNFKQESNRILNLTLNKGITADRLEQIFDKVEQIIEQNETTGSHNILINQLEALYREKVEKTA